MNQYLNDIFIQWHTDSYGTKYSMRRDNEPYIVVGNKIVLNEIPDRQYGIKILGMEETNKIEDDGDFKVDYINGFIFFHPSKDGQTITISTYYGRGVVMYPASRIYMFDAENNTVTLEEKIKIIEGKLSSLL